MATSSMQLMTSARAALAEASATPTATDRYAGAHLAALRAAAAVLAARARPAAVRGRPTSVWVLLADVAPEFGEWARFFAAGARKRAAAEAGLHSAVTAREADDLVRDASSFLDLAATAIGAAPLLVSPAAFSVAG